LSNFLKEQKKDDEIFSFVRVSFKKESKTDDLKVGFYL